MPKYILYALGEIALVVIGILIALQINNWNDLRKDQNLEIEYIKRLIDDLKVDTASISNTIKNTKEWMEHGKIVLNAYEQEKIPFSNANFARAIEYGLWFAYPAYSFSTYEELQSTGALRLIRDDPVKKAIADYRARIEWTEQFSTNWREVQQALEKVVPQILDIRIRETLFYERNEGPPWAPRQLTVNEEDARQMLKRLLDMPTHKSVYANMVRIQGAHYTNLEDIHALAHNALLTLEAHLHKLQF